jgi:hypothetical protein
MHIFVVSSLLSGNCNPHYRERQKVHCAPLKASAHPLREGAGEALCGFVCGGGVGGWTEGYEEIALKKSD